MRSDVSALDHSRAIVRELFGQADRRPFDVQYWDGSVDRGRGEADFALAIRRPGALRRMLLPPSEVSIVEAFIANDVDVVGEIERAVTLGDAINRQIRSPATVRRLLGHLVALPRHDDATNGNGAAGGARRAADVVEHAGARHDRARDRSAIQFHYDVGNEFYQLWLDPRMVYSCAYFATPEMSLEEAQLAKLDLVCRKLRLRAGERMLDVGCGWGALIIHAARHYGVDALGITLSESQAALARRRIADAGLRDRCRVELRDYRELGDTPPFDKIASVGMVEHVGVENLPVYFAALHRALAPGGLLLNHGIVNVGITREHGGWRQRLERRLWRRDEFIDQYVFPDGKLGPLHAVIAAGEAAGFETRDVESLRPHYALTLRAWLRRLLDQREAATNIVGERVFRTWRLYMAASAHGFASARLNVVQTLFAKPDARGNAALPMTRADVILPS
jgi:cyclopropane-fatty-acyl-phospholipid synthase